MRNTLIYGNYSIVSAIFRAIFLAIPTILIEDYTEITMPVYLVTLIPFIVLLIPSPKFILSMDLLYKFLLRPGAYIWAFICVINGPQDAIAIIFYIIAGLQIFSIIRGIFVGILLFPDLFL